MITFKEATQVRLKLKMKFSNYEWYKGSAVLADGDGYSISILVKHLDNNVRKIVAPVVEGVSVKTVEVSS